jgi:hypothetical protein
MTALGQSGRGRHPADQCLCGSRQVPQAARGLREALTVLYTEQEHTALHCTPLHRRSLRWTILNTHHTALDRRSVAGDRNGGNAYMRKDMLTVLLNTHGTALHTTAAPPPPSDAVDRARILEMCEAAHALRRTTFLEEMLVRLSIAWALLDCMGGCRTHRTPHPSRLVSCGFPSIWSSNHGAA